MEWYQWLIGIVIISIILWTLLRQLLTIWRLPKKEEMERKEQETIEKHEGEW